MTSFRATARRELVFLSLGAMDVCIITPLFASLLSLITPVRTLPVTIMFFCVVMGVHYAARLTLQSPLSPSLRSPLLALGILVSGLFTIHQLLHAQTALLNPAWLVDIFRSLQQESASQDILVFLSVLFFWQRGLVLAQRRLDSASVAFRFRLGLVALAVTIVVGGFILPWPLYQFVFVYFFFSLMGIGLARAEEVGQQYGGAQSPFNLGWLAALAAATLIILLLAAGVATLMTGESISRILTPLWAASRVFIAGLVYVLSWIMYAVMALLHTVFGEINLQGFEFAQPSLPAEGLPQQAGRPPFTPEQLALARSIGLIGGLLLLLLVVAFSLHKLRVRAGRRRGDERESVWEGIRLRRSLRDLLLRGRRRLDEAAALGRSFLGRFLAAMTIRRIYAHMSALAAEQGYPRAPHETPYEYRPTLERAFPENHAEIDCITEAYIAVHYGEIPERPQELEKVRAAWEHIQGAVTQA
ncbi:MAG: hypothetical protein B6I35_03605 [Anaerolineaceae bacterium 4572_32.2]|nr:MAG: hypothetical protein B6I35_03605 [Anaerolineaceae bacterium 4572_32.2]HEY71727.1 DUF4129 domain-containing protein [Thermoflexia bacterium]